VSDYGPTIQDEISQEQEKQEERYHLCERRFGSFGQAQIAPNDREASAGEAIVSHSPSPTTNPPMRNRWGGWSDYDKFAQHGWAMAVSQR
jgi:hypothetical protein